MRVPATIRYRLAHSLLALACLYAGVVAAIAAPAPVAGYKVIAKYPHSTGSYTEGFFYRDGLFYEGTGLEGHSAILAIEPATGNVVQRRELPAEYFGEGIVDMGPEPLRVDVEVSHLFCL